MQTEELNDQGTAASDVLEVNAAAEDDTCVAGSATLSESKRESISRRTHTIVQKHWPELHGCVPGTPNDNDRKRKLISAFRREFLPVEENYARYLLALHIQAGNRQRIWEISFPPFPLRCRRPRPPLTPWSLQGAQFLDRLDEGFWRSMDGGNAADDRELALQLLAAAILFDGQMSWQRIHALCECSPRGLCYGAERLSLDVPLTSDEVVEGDEIPADMPVWRWVVHWVPGILLCRWKARGGRPLHACLG